MTRSEDENKSDPRPPRETTALFGHDAAEREFLAIYRSGRVPHAWLIAGEPGIGKATIAYRIARFVLAHPDPPGSSDRAARRRQCPFRPVGAGAHIW